MNYKMISLFKKVDLHIWVGGLHVGGLHEGGLYLFLA